MSDHDPFTLDMFGSSHSGLSSGLGFGATAFSESPAIEPDKDVPPPAAPAKRSKSRQPAERQAAEAPERGSNFYLSGSRSLAKGWKSRARDNLDAISLAAAIAAEDRPATHEEQARLIRFTGFGASDLANAIFTRPGGEGFRKGWEDLGEELQASVDEADYASLARCTQYAHFTPEFIIRAIWKGLKRLGWRGGRILEPGIGTGLFPALMPEALRESAFVTGVELDPVTARIARLLQPVARIIEGDFARTDLPTHFDLAIGNPPFSDRTVRSDRAYRSMGLRLHDYFIARSIDLLKPGALAAFVTSSGTMDKADATARKYIAKSADLIAAIRLPEGSFRADAGTDVVVDILFFRKRKPGEAPSGASWLDLAEVVPATEDSDAIRVNRWFADHPDHVLGRHASTSGPFGEAYTCLADDGDLAADLDAAILSLPDDLYDGEPDVIDVDLELGTTLTDVVRPEDAHVREGSFVFDASRGLMQVLDGKPDCGSTSTRRKPTNAASAN